MIHNEQGLTIPGRRLAIIDVSIDIDESMDDQMFEVGLISYLQMNIQT